MASRFASVSETELEEIVAGAENENTKKATNVWLRAVTAFREEKELAISFAHCTA